MDSDKFNNNNNNNNNNNRFKECIIDLRLKKCFFSTGWMQIVIVSQS